MWLERSIVLLVALALASAVACDRSAQPCDGSTEAADAGVPSQGTDGGGSRPPNGSGGTVTGGGGELASLAQYLPAAGEWSLVPGTAFNDIRLSRAEADAIDPLIWGNSGSGAVLTAWNGAAYDDANHVMYFFGGGHYSYGGNEVYAIDLMTLTGARLNDPAPLSDLTSDPEGCPMPATGPAAPHTFDGFVFAPNTGTLFSFENMNNSCGSESWWGNWEAEFDPGTNAWSRISPFYTNSWGNGDGQQGINLSMSAYNPGDGKIWILDGETSPRLMTFDPVERQFVCKGTASLGWLNPNKAIIHDDGNGAALYFITETGDEAHLSKLTLPANCTDATWEDIVPITPLHEELLPYRSDGIGIAREGSLFAFWIGDSRVWTYDLVTDQWTLTNPPGTGPTFSTNGLDVFPVRIYGKWIYIAGLDAFAGYHNENEGLWLYCPVDGCGPPAVPVGPDPEGQGSFADLCRSDDIILCRDFSDAPPNVDSGPEGVFVNDGDVNATVPSVDDGRLKFTVRSESSAGAGGQYFVRFDPVMPGESIYVRWEQVFDTAFLEDQRAAGGGGFKLGMIGDAQQNSCASNEIVLQNVDWRGFVQGYHACGLYEGFYAPAGENDFDNQPGGDNVCLWQGSLQSDGTYLDEPGNCYGFAAGELMLFELAVDVSSELDQPSRIRVWVTRESRGRELVIDFSRVLEDAALGYGALWLTPYVTGKDPGVAHAEAHTWVDNLGVARRVVP